MPSVGRQWNLTGVWINHPITQVQYLSHRALQVPPNLWWWFVIIRHRTRFGSYSIETSDDLYEWHPGRHLEGSARDLVELISQFMPEITEKEQENILLDLAEYPLSSLMLREKRGSRLLRNVSIFLQGNRASQLRTEQLWILILRLLQDATAEDKQDNTRHHTVFTAHRVTFLIQHSCLHFDESSFKWDKTDILPFFTFVKQKLSFTKGILLLQFIQFSNKFKNLGTCLYL